MTVAITSDWIDRTYPTPTQPRERLLHALRRLGLHAVHLSRVLPRPALIHEALRQVRVDVVGVAVVPPHDAQMEGVHAIDGVLPAALAFAGAIHARKIVIHGGAVGYDVDPIVEAEAALVTAAQAGRAPEGEGLAAVEAARALREQQHQAALDLLVRALHVAHAEDAPMAVRNSRAWSGLLGLQEVEWLLGELPRASLWFDVAAAERAARAGYDGSLHDWLDRLAGRIGGIVATGLGPDWAGGCHPEEVAPDWTTMALHAPRGVPWVFEPRPALTETEVVDALRMLGSLAR